jgi:glutathione-regulated potassium-efflux system ancillary protein KefG
MGAPVKSPVLVLFAHPALHKSRVNRALVRAARGVEGVTVHDLYESYPDFDIDVAAEQRLLLDHDVIVMQHPFFWYSVPAILKEWMDLVLEHGWAYGEEGTSLRGKSAMSAVSTGGGIAAYTREGRSGYTMREFLRPIERTAALCGMHYLPPFLVQGTHSMRAQEIAAAADAYRRLLEALRDGRIAAERVRGLERINESVAAMSES